MKTGSQIKSLAQLRKAAELGLCVKSRLNNAVMPAAFVFNWQGCRILKVIESGLTVYRSEKPKPKYHVRYETPGTVQ